MIILFEENFDKQTLNLYKWEYDLGNGVAGWENNEFEYYRKNKENIYIENNQLHIKAKVNNYWNKNLPLQKKRLNILFNLHM